MKHCSVNMATIAALSIFSLVPNNARAVIFDTPVDGLFGLLDVELAYGVRYRLNDRDPELVALASGGSNVSQGNLDDGNLNYNENDLTANMVRAAAELTFVYKNIGFYGRGFAFYDYEHDHHDRERTQLGSNGKEQVRGDIRILDYYVDTQLELGELPVHLRIGEQVVNWGESTFFGQSGVNVINPIDLGLLNHPTTEAKDLQLPVGMAWGSLHFSERFSVEAYYQYDWKPTELPARGTYLSPIDSSAPDAKIAQFTGVFSDQGQILNPDPEISNEICQRLLVPSTAGPNGECYSYFKAFRGKNITPDEQGQWGLALQFLIPKLNDTRFALYYANYHAKLPGISGISISETTNSEFVAALDTWIDAGAKGNPLLDPGYNLALSNAANDITYNLQYYEDIQMFGFSFNTTTIHTGTAISGEISYHTDFPVIQHLGQAMPAALGPGIMPLIVGAGGGGVEFLNGGEFVADTSLESAVFMDKVQSVLGLTQLLGPRLGAVSTGLGLEAAWLHFEDFPNKDTFRLNQAAFALLDYGPQERFGDRDSWGYRLVGFMTYENVLGGLTVSPKMVFTHDVDGNAPGAIPFLEDRKSFTIKVTADYADTISSELRYTTFWGGDKFNLVNDRDFLDVVIRYSF